MSSEREYYCVERFTLKGWVEIKPWEVQNGSIFRMFESSPRTYPIEDVTGGKVWIANSESSRRIDSDNTHTWVITTQRINPYREMFWRIKNILGLFDEHEIV